MRIKPLDRAQVCTSVRGVPPTCAHAVDVSRFRPKDAAAGRKLKFLLDRGGLVMSAGVNSVSVMHAGRTARIDARGRVSWPT